ncbi:MAG: ATP-binding protein [Thermodesulfobacteriota bacterium]|nr:ATP-binding protein [Thermodesulfobacteriota bacterium]
MKTKISGPDHWTWFSPWVIIGSVCILAAVLAVLAVKNIRREQGFMERALRYQADILMEFLEAGSRTGMRGPGGGGRRHIQTLMEETAQQPEVLYITLVDGDGRIVASSDPQRIGGTRRLPPVAADGTLHRFIDTPQQAFEVIRAFQPWSGCNPRHRNICMERTAALGDNLLLIVGMDPSPFEAAMRQDRHQTILLFGVMFLAGAAGFISLFWAQHYRSARRSLLDMERLSATVFNQMPAGLITTDLRGTVRQTNTAARDILRLPGGIPGRLDELACFAAVRRQLERGAAVLEEEVTCCAGGDAVIPLLVNASVIHDGEGRKAGYVFLFTDMTGIKQLEEQLRRSERLAALGRLSAGIAHEIRNPLSSIKGFAAILAKKVQGDENARALSKVMEDEVNRLNRVVTELLEFARPTELQKRRTAVKELIEHSLRLVESDAQAAGIRLSVDVRPQELRAEFDPDRFSQVLLNLYLNAIQAMDRGGRLSVEAERHEDEWVLQVEDTGCGIEPAEIPHIFDPYFTTKPRGVGLGLAVVHKIVEAHNGEIDVESSPGRGTRFTIRLPLGGTAACPSPEERRAAPSSGKTQATLTASEESP